MLKKIAGFFGIGKRRPSSQRDAEHFSRHRVSTVEVSSANDQKQQPERIRFVNREPSTNTQANPSPDDSPDQKSENANPSVKSTETASLSSCTTTTTLPTNTMPPRRSIDNTLTKPKSAPTSRSLGGLSSTLQQPAARAQSAGVPKGRRLVQPSSEFSPFNRPAEESCASAAFSGVGSRHKQPIDPLSNDVATSSQSNFGSNSSNVVFSQKSLHTSGV